MARSGIYKSEVARARERLLAMGHMPTIDAIRLELGNTGSKTTIQRYVKEIEEEAGGTTGSKVSVSEAIQDLVGRLAARLNEEADARVLEVQTQSAATVSKLQADFTSLKTEGQATRQQLEQTQRSLADEKANHAKTQEALSGKNVEAAQLSQRVVDLQERLAREEQHRQSLEEKHQHAREALEHFRASAKEQREQEQRQHDQQVQYLQSELRKATDTLTGKQQELMRLQQEGVRLIGDLSRVQAELHQAQEELRKLRPLKDALAFEQRRTEELGQRLVAQDAANQQLQASGGETQARLDAVLLENQRLQLDVTAAKAAVKAQEAVVAGMLQRLSATTPPADSPKNV